MQLSASGSRQSARAIGTLCTCQVHYICWCYAMNLDDDILLLQASWDRCVLQMACYAVHLCSGSTYHHKHVTSGAVTAYLAAASTMIASRSGRDPHKWSAADQSFATEVSSVLTEYWHWEVMPNRREPWTPEMQRNLDDFNEARAYRPDSLEVAIADFTGAGLQVGYRVSEYAQTESNCVAVGSFAKNMRTREAVALP
jgi:hypothetical protein